MESASGKYFAFFKLFLKRSFAYRFDFAVWSVLHPIRLTVLYFLWSAVFNYSGAAALGGLTLSEMINYFVIGVVLDTYVGADIRLSELIYKGDILTEFVRPIVVFWRLLANEFANRTIAFLFHMLPTAVFAFIFLGFRIYSVPFTLLAIVSAFLGLLLNFEYAFIFATSTFWTKSYYGTRSLKEGLLYLAGGWLIPLTLYPAFVQNILYYTPLPYISFFPNMIYLGKYTIPTALSIILLQVFWLVCLFGVYRVVWHFAKKRFTGVGV